MFSKKILSLVAVWLLLVLNAFSANSRFTLVIDAGHGGHDAGALGVEGKGHQPVGGDGFRTICGAQSARCQGGVHP